MKDRGRRARNFEQADGSSKSKYHGFLKRAKRRLERRRARHNPECIPGYGRYTGYEM